MNLHVIHTAREAELERFEGDLVIVIDALRATTVVATALAAGAQRIFPALTVEDAFELRREMPEALLCGEREGYAVPGFDYGNSPVEIGALDMTGRDMILTTTNGTRAAKAAMKATVLLAASLVNLSAVSGWIEERIETHDDGGSIVIVCSGTNERYSIDDAYVAGALIQKLEGAPLELSDAAVASRMLADSPAEEIINPEVCFHAAYLKEKGLYSDVDFLLGGDRFTSIPRFRDRFFECGFSSRDGCVPRFGFSLRAGAVLML